MTEPIARDYEELARMFESMKFFQSEVQSADDIIEKENARRIHALEQLESYREKASSALHGVGIINIQAPTSNGDPVINITSEVDAVEIQKIIDRSGRWDGRL